MRDYIPIKKDLVPYYFQIVLDNKWYTITVDYNKVGQFFTVGLNYDDKVLTAGEKLVYGKALFNDILYKDNVPSTMIIPCDEAGNSNTITWDNLNETVFLYLFNTSDMRIYYSIVDSNNTEEIQSAIEQVSYESISPELRNAMLSALTDKGINVNYEGDVPTFDELLKAVRGE